MQVVKMPLDRLKEMDKNVRVHTKIQIKEYVRSLKMFGQTKPIVIDENGNIIIGNGLYQALLEMGKTEADCIVMNGISEKQKKKLMLADNRVYELGATDAQMFDEIIKDLGGDIDVPGWSEDVMRMLNQSVEETNRMIENYGVFDSKEVDRMNRKTYTPQDEEDVESPEAAPDHGQHTFQTQGQPAPQQPQTASHGQADATEAPFTAQSTSETPDGPAEAKGEENRDYIICPHCGGKIWL